MRPALLFAAIWFLAGCAGMSDYNPDTGSSSSQAGAQGGAGVQTSIWSNDPGKQTVTNQNPSASGN